MKMMNAEMEFVTFEANDVITTSGGFTKVSYITGTTNYPGLSGYAGEESNKLLLSAIDSDHYMIGINNASQAQGISWLWQGVAQVETVESINSIPGYENAELDPIDINTFENYGALIEWLNKASNGLFGQ